MAALIPSHTAQESNDGMPIESVPAEQARILASQYH